MIENKLQPWTSTLQQELTTKTVQYHKTFDHELPAAKEDEMYEDIQRFFDVQTMAEEFIKVQPLYYDKSKLWWMWKWNKLKWDIIDETQILLQLRKAAKDKLTGFNIFTPTMKSMILESLKQEARKKKPKPVPNTWIQFNDSIIDITQKEMIRYIPTPEYFITNFIPWSISYSDETPILDKILEEWVGEDYVQTLKEIIAYCMLADYPLHKIFCLVGAGMNGKSKYIELLTRIIGIDNVTSTDLDLLLTSRFETAKLYKKLVCIMGETNFTKMNKTAVIKRLTGQDLIGFEFKNKLPFNDYNYAKLLIATNSLPPTQDKTTGFYRRWVIIDFPNKFNEKKDILNDIPRIEYERLVRKCIKLLKGLLKEREFHNEGTIEQKEKKYEDISNPLQKFLKDHVDEDFDGFITKEEFREFFWGWQRQNGYRKWSDTQIGLALKQEYSWDQGKRAVDGDVGERNVNVWVGVKWRGLRLKQ